METWFLLHCYVLVIHQATQDLNYGPVMQSQGHQSMSIGTALFTLCFPVLVFHNPVGCFTRPGLVFRNGHHVRSYLSWCLMATRPTWLQQPL